MAYSRRIFTTVCVEEIKITKQQRKKKKQQLKTKQKQQQILTERQAVPSQ